MIPIAQEDDYGCAVACMAFVLKIQKVKCGHYLVRNKNKWMDPWINFPNVNRSAGFRKRLPGRPIYMISK